MEEELKDISLNIESQLEKLLVWAQWNFGKRVFIEYDLNIFPEAQYEKTMIVNIDDHFIETISDWVKSNYYIKSIKVWQ